MRILMFICSILISLSSYAQEKDYDIYILGNRSSYLRISKFSRDSVTTEYYSMTWPKKNIDRIITYKIDSAGMLRVGGRLPYYSNYHYLRLRYENNLNKNPPKLIFSRTPTDHNPEHLKTEWSELKTMNVMMLEHFQYADAGEIFGILKRAKNLYIIIEEEKSGDYYLAKKVEILE